MKLFILFIPIFLFADKLEIKNFNAIDNIVLVASSLLLGYVGFHAIEKAITIFKV